MIQKLIDEALSKKQEERKNRKRSGKYSPSSFGKCYRSQYWNRKNEPQTNPPDSRTLRVFNCGTLFHDFVQGFLPKHDCEVEVKTEYALGFADIVTKDSVIDIKSVHSQAFWYMEKGDYDVNTQKLPNILQVGWYAMQLGKPKFELMFVSKDDLCIAEYSFITEKWKENIVREITALSNFWVKDELPKAEPRCYINKKTGKSKECGYCGWKDKCKETEDAKK